MLSTDDEILWRWVKATLILAFIISAGFIVLFLTQKKIDKLYRTYPDVDCDTLKETYEEDMLQYYAMIEWYHHMKEDNPDSLLKLSTENMQCFCLDLMDEIGKTNAMNWEFQISAKHELITGKVC